MRRFLISFLTDENDVTIEAEYYDVHRCGAVIFTGTDARTVVAYLPGVVRSFVEQG